MISSVIKNFESFILEELKSYDSIDDILSRINKTEYISKSIEKELISLSSDPNIVKNIIKKVEQLDRFYKKARPDYIEDIMISMLDALPYDCVAKIGFYIPKQYRYYSYSFLRDIDLTTWVYVDVDNIDMKKMILIGILKSMKKFNKESQENSLKSKEEAKTKNSWILNPRSRSYDPVDYLRQVSTIEPIIRIEFIHDEYPDFWEYEQHQLQDMYGITSDEFSGTWKEDSVISKIKKSTRLSRLGEFEASSPGIMNTYTVDRFWIEDAPVVNPRPILVKGCVDLNFKLTK